MLWASTKRMAWRCVWPPVACGTVLLFHLMCVERYLPRAIVKPCLPNQPLCSWTVHSVTRKVQLRQMPGSALLGLNLQLQARQRKGGNDLGHSENPMKSTCNPTRHTVSPMTVRESITAPSAPQEPGHGLVTCP